MAGGLNLHCRAMASYLWSSPQVGKFVNGRVVAITTATLLWCQIPNPRAAGQSWAILSHSTEPDQGPATPPPLSHGSRLGPGHAPYPTTWIHGAPLRPLQTPDQDHQPCLWKDWALPIWFARQKAWAPMHYSNRVPELSWFYTANTTSLKQFYMEKALLTRVHPSNGFITVSKDLRFLANLGSAKTLSFMHARFNSSLVTPDGTDLGTWSKFILSNYAIQLLQTDVHIQKHLLVWNFQSVYKFTVLHILIKTHLIILN